MSRLMLAFAAGTALLVTSVSGIFVIPLLRKLHFGQTIKEIGPTWHADKQGTPQMGGIMFYAGTLLGVAAGYAVFALTLPQVLAVTVSRNITALIIAVVTSLAYGAVGFADDYIKAVKKRNLGLKARYKIIGQTAITAAFLASLHLCGLLSTAVQLPVFGTVELSWAFYPLSFILIIFMVNAVNLTDGIDGLCSSVTFVVMLCYMFTAGVLGFPSVGMFAAAVAGGMAGFLVWNFHPAKIFMGDTGSLFLGGAVVSAAYCMGRPEMLFFMGFLYMVEGLSVVLQVSYFKLTHGKRIFKMSPLHHHFEMCGWSENKIVGVFSAVAALFAVLGVAYVYLW